MTAKTRKRELENQRWHEQHAHERGVATRAAERQRLVADGKQLLESGLRPVPLSSIADDMNRADPRTAAFHPDDVRRIAATRHEPLPPDHEEDDMETATYISGTRVKPFTVKSGGNFKNGKTGKVSMRLPVPSDIAEKIPAGIEFDVELTEAGLLFRPAGMRTVHLPAWAQNGHAVKR